MRTIKNIDVQARGERYKVTITPKHGKSRQYNSVSPASVRRIVANSRRHGYRFAIF